MSSRVRRVFILGASITTSLFVFHVGVVPLIFKYSKSFRRNLVFANFVQWPLNIDFDDPSSCGIDGARNFSIEYESKVDKCRIKIGMWHILPETAYKRLKHKFEEPCDKEELSRVLTDELAKTTSPIILYCHGNSNSRAAAHRIELYRFFQKMDFHTIAFDYRGYADSTAVKPTEAGVVEDALEVYQWLDNATMRRENNRQIFVWGHSLGTAISSHMLGNIDLLSAKLLGRAQPLPLPNGLILESPFNNLADEVAQHPLAKLVTWLPYFERTFVVPFRDNCEQTFTSDLHLARQKTLPVLILHAKDDLIVPFLVGVKLYKSLVKSRSNQDAKVKFHAFGADEKLGHKDISHAKNLDMVIRQFVMENKP